MGYEKSHKTTAANVDTHAHDVARQFTSSFSYNQNKFLQHKKNGNERVKALGEAAREERNCVCADVRLGSLTFQFISPIYSPKIHERAHILRDELERNNIVIVSSLRNSRCMNGTISVEARLFGLALIVNASHCPPSTVCTAWTERILKNAGDD